MYILDLPEDLIIKIFKNIICENKYNCFICTRTIELINRYFYLNKYLNKLNLKIFRNQHKGLCINSLLRWASPPLTPQLNRADPTPKQHPS